jgi:hypothetical protein
VSNCAAASGKIWEYIHHFLFTCGERPCSRASTSGIHYRSLTAGVKKRQINWAAVHLFVLNRDLPQDQVTYSPSSKQLYTSVEHERNNVVESSNLRRDRCAKTYIYLFCSAWAITNQSQVSCTESARYLRRVANLSSTVGFSASSSAASLGQLHITVGVYENQYLHINGILNAHERHGI